MNAQELLTLVAPMLQRQQGKLVVSLTALGKLTRSLIGERSAPELYKMVTSALVVITAVGEMQGGRAAAEQLRAELLEPIVARVGQHARVDLARRRARSVKPSRPTAMVPPTMKGVRARPKP